MNTQPERGLGYHLVLIVEDDRAVRDSLKFSFVVEGFAVRAYPDTEHLLAEEHLPDFDCLIVDQNMPGMNGHDLISSLRARKVEAPAILITSHPNSSPRDRAAAAGIPIIEKPLLLPRFWIAFGTPPPTQKANQSISAAAATKGKT